MAVDVKTSGLRFEARTDKPVFDSRTLVFGFIFYDVSKIVVNWTAGLKK